MTEAELLALVDAEFETAMGGEGGEISKERAIAYDYYLAKLFGDEVEGQSQVVTSDVADVVDGIMPSLLRIFTTADNLVDFDPVGMEDIEAAEQESDTVNYVFFKQNPAFMILFYWFFDALVQKNGVVKAWRDESEIVSTETYKNLTDEAVAEFLDDEELEPIERDEHTEEIDIGGVMAPVTLHDITFRRVSKRGRVRAENVPPEEYRISADSRSIDPSEARMVGHERLVTRSDLLDMGFDKKVVDGLPTHGEMPRSEEDISRRDRTDEQDDNPKDRSQEKILVREAYIRVDFDDDGRSELRQVFTAGSEILSNEVVDRQPFHVISPHPLPHKHFGRATAEKVTDIQKINSTLVRQMLDNLYHTNNPSHGVWEMGMGEHTLDDLLTRRAGTINRFARPPQESYMPMTVPFTAAASFPMLEYWEKAKRDRTGISSDGEGLNPEALKNIQQSVLAAATDLSRMKIEAIARIFAETGIKSLFLHIHELLLKHQDRPMVMRLRNKFVEVDPSQWRTRLDMTVKIGLGIGTREQNLVHLQAIWEKQSEMVDKGALGLTVLPRHLYNTAAEFVKNANLKAPEMFFRDPGEEMPDQNDGNAEAQMQAVIAQLQNQAREIQNDRERNLLQHEREMLKIQQAQEKMTNDLTVALEKIATDLTKIEAESGKDVPGSRI